MGISRRHIGERNVRKATKAQEAAMRETMRKNALKKRRPHNPRMIHPVFGEAFVHKSGRIFARIRTRRGTNYVNTNDGEGFRSMIAALDFVNIAVRNGIPLKQIERTFNVN